MTKRKDPDERKENITFRFKSKLIREIKQIPNYNSEVETLLEEHVKKKQNERD